MRYMKYPMITEVKSDAFVYATLTTDTKENLLKAIDNYLASYPFPGYMTVVLDVKENEVLKEHRARIRRFSSCD